jgi:large subunit ribosomal protein L10
MPTQRKIETLEKLTDKMSRMQFAVVADYRGMNVAEITDLRTKMYENGAEVIVAKNTLLRMAARASGRESIEPLLVGPTAITFAYDHPAKVAKVIDDYAKGEKKYTIRGGLLGSALIQANELDHVAKMPSREALYAQIVGCVQAPMTGIVGVLQAPVSDVVGILQNVVSDVAYVLQARIDQMQSANS